MLQTERCLISPFEKSDFVDVKTLYTDERVRKYLGGTREIDSLEIASSNGSFYWVVREKYTNSFMGLVSLDTHHDGIYRELSYQFSPYWWGKGYATEVLQLIISYAFKELKLPVIVAETQMANIPSCRLLERLGMKIERTLIRYGAEQSIYIIKNLLG